MSNDFAWDTNESVVVKPRSGVAIYWNTIGLIEVRVQAFPQDDDILQVTAEEAEAIISGLSRIMLQKLETKAKPNVVKGFK